MSILFKSRSNLMDWRLIILLSAVLVAWLFGMAILSPVHHDPEAKVSVVAGDTCCRDRTS